MNNQRGLFCQKLKTTREVPQHLTDTDTIKLACRGWGGGCCATQACRWRTTHQRRLRAAVGGLVVREEQRVLGEHGHGSQHERHKQVDMDVVPRAVEPPANAHTHTHRGMLRSVFTEGVGV